MLYRADVTIHVHGHFTVEAKDETQATVDIMDGKYALSDLTIDSDDWEIDYMRGEQSETTYQRAEG